MFTPTVGQNVRLMPHTDEWMRGIRYALVERVNVERRQVLVRMHKLDTYVGYRRLSFDDVAEIKRAVVNP